ncbi:hypothetical protein NW760_15502 [Fusarium oxysporum]|nr:hypothetical protein NW760_15502 [Fusarium oxysporum]
MDNHLNRYWFMAWLMPMAWPSAGDQPNRANVPMSFDIPLHKLARRLLELGGIFYDFVKVAAVFPPHDMTSHRTIVQLIDILSSLGPGPQHETWVEQVALLKVVGHRVACFEGVRGWCWRCRNGVAKRWEM